MKYLYSNIYWELNKEYNLDKLLYLMIDRPNQINMFDDYFWLNDKNQRHRDYDLPSHIDIYNKSYDVHWYQNNKRHRENNEPSFIRCDGYKQYWINGNLIVKNK